MIGVLNGLQANRFGGLDIVVAVVEEEYARGLHAERGNGVPVDGGVGFGDAETVRKGEVVEAGEPGAVPEHAGFHGIAEVGEDARAHPGGLERGGPVDHGLVRLRPERGIGVDEGLPEFGREGMSQLAGNGAPVAVRVEGAAVIVVARTPVGGVKGVFFGPEQGLYPLPGGRMRRSGEDETVVEEHGLDSWWGSGWWHPPDHKQPPGSLGDLGGAG